jgi:hypothetical protein
MPKPMSVWPALPWMMFHSVLSIPRMVFGALVWAGVSVGFLLSLTSIPLTAQYARMQPSDWISWVIAIYFVYYVVLTLPAYLAMAIDSYQRVAKALLYLLLSVIGFVIAAFAVYYGLQFLTFIFGWIFNAFGTLVHNVLVAVHGWILLGGIGDFFDFIGTVIYDFFNTGFMQAAITVLKYISIVLLAISAIIFALVVLYLLLFLLYASHTLKDPISNARYRLYTRWAQRSRRRNQLERAAFFERAAQEHDNPDDDEIPADVIPILGLVAPAYFIMKNLGLDVLDFVGD